MIFHGQPDGWKNLGAADGEDLNVFGIKSIDLHDSKDVGCMIKIFKSKV